MKKLTLFVVFFTMMSSVAFADRVCIRKSDGVPIEYQSGNAPLGTLKQNAITAGYKEEDIIEEYITPQEYATLHDQKITQVERAKKEQKQQAAEDKIKEKLGLTDAEFKDLKEALSE